MNRLEKRCLSLPREDRERLVNTLLKSLDHMATGKTMDEIHDAVVKVFGKEILNDSRNRADFIGRVIFSYVCALEGYSETCIGGYINRNHSCVNMMKKTMKGWMQMPRFYNEEIARYNKVMEELNYETDR